MASQLHIHRAEIQFQNVATMLNNNFYAFLSGNKTHLYGNQTVDTSPLTGRTFKATGLHQGLQSSLA